MFYQLQEILIVLSMHTITVRSPYHTCSNSLVTLMNTAYDTFMRIEKGLFTEETTRCILDWPS